MGGTSQPRGWPAKNSNEFSDPVKHIPQHLAALMAELEYVQAKLAERYSRRVPTGILLAGALAQDRRIIWFYINHFVWVGAPHPLT